MTDPDPTGGAENPASLAQPRWTQVIEDMEATAAGYREDGWGAVVIHPGDVATFTAQNRRRGFDLLAPDNEFKEAAALFDRCEGFESAEVFRAVENAVVYLVIAMEDSDEEVALCVPAYYSHADDTDFVEMLESTETLPIHVRPLDQRRILTFTHNDPSLFLPAE